MSKIAKTLNNGSADSSHNMKNDYVRKIREVLILSKSEPRNLLAVEDYLDELKSNS